MDSSPPADGFRQIEALNRRLSDLEKELAEQECLADLGELTGPVTHELSNFLNSLLLHVAVLEHETPEGGQCELAEIRRQGNEMSAMLRSLQDYYKLRRLELEVIDLNSVVNTTVQQLRGAAGGDKATPSASRIGLELSTDLLTVSGNRTDLKRLCVFLIRNAIAATNENKGCVTIRTERTPDKALLRVEDTGPIVSQAQLAQIFEPHLNCREGTSSLELAACQSLARGLRCAIRAEPGLKGGVSISVLLPLAPK